MQTRKKLKFTLWYWLPPVLFAIFIFGVSAIPDLKSAFPAPLDLVLRKIAHVTEFFVLTLLFARIQLHGKQRELHVSVLFGSAALALYAAFLDEFLIQGLTPGRFASFEDVGIDSAGILAALVFLLYFGKQGRKK